MIKIHCGGRRPAGRRGTAASGVAGKHRRMINEAAIGESGGAGRVGSVGEIHHPDWRTCTFCVSSRVKPVQ